jgi:hypothetical protein
VALELIVKLSKALGVSQTSIVEMAIRELAKRNKIKLSGKESSV